ncbi:MAG: hypothetical protein ACREDR_00230 [Blastocatellia bacterium]
MTLSGYIALARDFIIVAALAAVLYLVYRAGEDHIGAKDLQGLQQQIAAQSKILADWRKESTDANTQLSTDLKAINLAAAAPIRHQWVCEPGTGQTSPVLSSPARQAGYGVPSAGSVQPELGAAPQPDRRDAILAAFKQRWESVLATCRAEDSQWPQ